ncbi:MAG: dienelactone hydrolase family protein [Candidatus Baltobacteraceae bacterium]
MNRRAFVGVSAAAAAVTASNAPALAQTSPLGKTHPPLVPEGDPAIVVDRAKLERPDAKIDAYAAWPAGASTSVPSVVVIMHVWGVDTSIRDVVRRLAKAGFAAIAPDLYARFGAPSGDGASDYTVFRPYSHRLDRAQYGDDIRAAALWLRAKFPRTKVGLLGFCMGGRIVLTQTIDNAHLFGAACPFYGPIADIDPTAVAVPVCGSYGARDTSIPAESVLAFQSKLTVPNDFRIYDNAGHAFFDDQRPSYDAEAAADAWKRSIAFLEAHLGKPTS